MRDVVWWALGAVAVLFAASFVLRWLKFGEAAVYVNASSKLLLRGMVGVIFAVTCWKLATYGNPWLIVVAIPAGVLAAWVLLTTGAAVWLIVREGTPDDSVRKRYEERAGTRS